MCDVLHTTENVNTDEECEVAVALMQSLEVLPPEAKIKYVRLRGCDWDYNLRNIDIQTPQILPL